MIKEFQDENRFLSNFWYASIECKGKNYPTSEHLFQSLKMKYPEHQELVRLSASPWKAKRLGGNKPAVDNWNDIREKVMYNCVRLKFIQNRDIRQKLFNTGDLYLQEGNTWHDNTWGTCFCYDCVDMVGLNMLGNILMKVRKELKEEL